MAFFNCNGKLYKENEAVFGPANRGLRYGDGVFETLKLIDSKLIFANEHFARLWKGLQILQFNIPKHFTPEKLTEQIIALAGKNQHHKAARVRLTIVRGNGGLFDAVNHQPNYTIETMPLPENSHTLNSNGLVLGIYNEVKKSCDAISNIKHNNYLPYVLAALQAKKQQWNDAVVLNMHGNICETTVANIFLIKDETIFTPALTEGCVAGVARLYLIDFLKTNGYTINQSAITPEVLYNADEVFITNVVYNLRWVQSINSKQYSTSFTQKIYAAFAPTILQ